MNKLFTIAILLIVTAVLSGCVAPVGGETGVILKDCGSDQSCFETAAQTCEPAKIVVSTEDESSIMGMYSEIRGLEGDNCILYLRVTQFEMKTAGIPLDPSEQELFDQLQEGFKILEGKEMVCNIPKDTIAESDLLSMTNPEDLCTGSLITVLGQIQ